MKKKIYIQSKPVKYILISFIELKEWRFKHIFNKNTNITCECKTDCDKCIDKSRI